jgi:hypothetical protein
VLTPGRISPSIAFPKLENDNVNDSTEIARINRPAIGPARFLRNVIEINTVDQAMEIAKMMAIAKQAVPKHLRNEPGMCLAVILQAKEWEMAPYAVARKSYVVNDTLAYESQLIHAVIEARAPIKTRLNCSYEGEGPTRQCIVVGTFQGDTEPREYTSPQVKDIKVKNSPLWTSDLDQQLFYYSSRAWCRKWCPDVLLGVYAPDEIAPGSENAKVIHNPLQEDAEVADGRELGDEVPPKQVRTVLDGQAAVDALTTPEPEDGAVVHVDGSVTRPGDHGHPTADEVRDMTEVSKPPRQARRKAQDAPQPEPAPEPPPAEKPAPAPNGGAPDWRGLGTKVWATLTGENYMAYLRKWTTAMAMAGGGPTYAVELRNRFVAERDIRNNLGTPLDAAQQDEAKQIAAAAYKQLGGA